MVKGRALESLGYEDSVRWGLRLGLVVGGAWQKHRSTDFFWRVTLSLPTVHRGFPLSGVDLAKTGPEHGANPSKGREVFVTVLEENPRHKEI